jgi:hypothetical protein
MTTKLPIPFHPTATDAATIIISALVEYFRGSPAMRSPHAGRIVWRRLVDMYGEKVVERALRICIREARREQQALRRESRSLKRQVRLAKAAYLKRQTGV